MYVKKTGKMVVKDKKENKPKKRVMPKMVKKKQGLQARLDEAEGKKKGKKAKKQNVGDRLDEAEPKKKEKGKKVSWTWRGKTYSGTLIPSKEDKDNRYARTENGKIKVLPKKKK